VNVAQNALVTGEEPRRYGNEHASIVPYRPFRTADGWIAVAAANDGLFRRLCSALDRQELGADERYATNAARVRNRETLAGELEPVFASRTADDWLDVLLAAGVPAGKIRGVGEALRAAGATATVTHPTAGPLELVSAPFSLLEAGIRAPEPPPLLGEHTDEVLAELGVSAERLADLAARGVIVCAGAA
jgi:crotonobetainyl-CoA:carnitine CoA-transferase CaiB-like acyl-CoA transferase